LIDQGLSTQVMLNDGSMILRFLPHDVIARGSVQTGVVVVRGMDCDEPQVPRDLVIPLCDIAGVFSERPRQVYAADPDFRRRNPLPRGWTMVHARALNAVTAR
jgi:hypothetical protein